MLDLMLLILRWMIFAFVFIFFALIAFYDFWVFFQDLLGRKHRSMIPFVGGFIGMLAVLILSVEHFKYYWWIPFVLDMGSVPLLVRTILFFLLGKHRRKKPSKHKYNDGHEAIKKNL